MTLLSDMLFFYNLFLRIYSAGLHIASIWNPKAKQWVEGRKSIIHNIRKAVNERSAPTIWMHCASLGEFEQGRPVLEALRKAHVGHRILLTFFSPSGYEVRKNNSGSDHVFYLPMDGKRNAQDFLDAIDPELVIFVKYESWYYYLNELKRRKIPTLLVSAIFKPEQNFFGPFGRFLRSMLDHYTHIFVQDSNSLDLLKKFGVRTPCSIAGDTRFDRVTDVINQPFINKHISSFCEDSEVLVAGSTWEEDEKMLAGVVKEMPRLKLIIAPHEVNDAVIQQLQEKFDNCILLTELEAGVRKGHSNILVIDCIGMLSKLYRFSTLCYVGGGFNAAGIHNILEPAAYGRVVIFGPNHQRSAEPSELIASGSGFSYERQRELIEIVSTLLEDKSTLEEKNQVAKKYVETKKGATKRVTDYIEKNLRLSN